MERGEGEDKARIAELEGKVATLEGQLENLQTALDGKENEFHAVVDEKREITGKAGALQALVDNLQRDRTNLQTSLNELKVAKGAVDGEIGALKALVDGLQHEKTNLQMSLDDLKVQKGAVDERVEGLENDLSTLKRQCVEAEQRAGNLQEQLDRNTELGRNISIANGEMEMVQQAVDKALAEEQRKRDVQVKELQAQHRVEVASLVFRAYGAEVGLTQVDLTAQPWVDISAMLTADASDTRISQTRTDWYIVLSSSTQRTVGTDKPKPCVPTLQHRRVLEAACLGLFADMKNTDDVSVVCQGVGELCKILHGSATTKLDLVRKTINAVMEYVEGRMVVYTGVKMASNLDKRLSIVSYYGLFLSLVQAVELAAEFGEVTELRQGITTLMEKVPEFYRELSGAMDTEEGMRRYIQSVGAVWENPDCGFFGWPKGSVMVMVDFATRCIRHLRGDECVREDFEVMTYLVGCRLTVPMGGEQEDLTIELDPQQEMWWFCGCGKRK